MGSVAAAAADDDDNVVHCAESTVSGLLACSGRLRSSLQPQPLPTFKYRERCYESASDALDAYITDFQRSMRSSDVSVGHIELPTEAAVHHRLHTGYRNKDVLREKLTDRELDLLNLPTRTRHRDSDLLSLTTDDLLLLPPDGSLPVTRTSAFLSLSGHYSGSSPRTSHGSAPKNLFHSPKTSNRARAGAVRQEGRLCVDDLLQGGVASQHRDLPPETDRLASRMSPYHHLQLPRWITSHKSEMDFSGLTSVPQLHFPPWLAQCDAATAGEVARNAAPNLPSWIGELERSDEGLQGTGGLGKGRGQRPWGIRLQKAAEERSMWNSGDVFRGDRISSLIERAEAVLKSPVGGVRGAAGEQPRSPVGTEELLEAERSWDQLPVTYKSPVPVGGAEVQASTEKTYTDTRDKSMGSCSSGYGSRKHPGPVEALKQMLFSLQAVEQRVSQDLSRENPPKVTQQTDAEPQSSSSSLKQCGDEDDAEVPQPDAGVYDSVPGGRSLERALHHLGRLKSLVEEMNEKKARGVQQEGEL